MSLQPLNSSNSNMETTIRNVGVSSNHHQSSFVDKSIYFEDLNASFKLLFKSLQRKRDLFESGKVLLCIWA